MRSTLPHDCSNRAVSTRIPSSAARLSISDISPVLVASTVILVVMLLGSIGALFAFSWAATHHQFEDLEKAAESIFDADEPIGTPTDKSITDSHDP
jgi:cbb3-type cytochrome oxidase maturation protein